MKGESVIPLRFARIVVPALPAIIVAFVFSRPAAAATPPTKSVFQDPRKLAQMSEQPRERKA